MTAFEDAAVAAVAELGASATYALADRLVTGWPSDAIIGSVASRDADAVRGILRAREDRGLPLAEAAAFLRGVAAAHANRTSQVQTEIVWSGPSSHAVPVRATAQVLIDLIDQAERELVMMTYSARRHDGITAALTNAIDRGVTVDVVVETLQGAGSLLAGSEPAAAFADISGLRLWHWPVDQRDEASARMHAKLAVADRRVLLVSSANLTMSGVSHNIESGVLVRGGSAPLRAAEHVVDLQASGVLRRLVFSR